MTAFWISTGLLTLLVLAVLCWPLLRRHGGAGASRKAINTAIYRDQLAELERDLASGVLSQADYGVDVSPRLKTLKVAEPPVRSAGIKVAYVDALVAKLKEMGVAG